MAFGPDMILAYILCKNFAGIKAEGYPQTFIEGVPRLSLSLPSFSMFVQMISKTPSFLRLEAASVGSVIGRGKYTIIETFILGWMLSCRNRDHHYVSTFSLSTARVSLITS
jgi:hypothetical protein